MTRKETARLVGTAVLTIAAAVPYAAGIWTAWVHLFSRLPMPLGVLATLGAVIAPVQLVRDVLHADREDRRRKDASPPEK